jgi:hypothetical protein
MWVRIACCSIFDGQLNMLKGQRSLVSAELLAPSRSRTFGGRPDSLAANSFDIRQSPTADWFPSRPPGHARTNLRLRLGARRRSHNCHLRQSPIHYQ